MFVELREVKVDLFETVLIHTNRLGIVTAFKISDNKWKIKGVDGFIEEKEINAICFFNKDGLKDILKGCYFGDN